MPVVCLSLKEVFWKIVSIAYHWPLPLIRAYFSLRSATGFISWEGRKKSTFTTLTGQLSVGHRRSSRASLCKAFSVQVCILPADPKGINSLSSYMQSLPASRVCRQGDELVYLNYRWASERFINLLWDTQQSKKVGKLALDARRWHQRQECKSTIWNIVTGVASSPRTTGCGHD